MAELKPRLNIITLGVTDHSAMRAFYSALGFQLSESSNDNISFFKAGGVVLALFGKDALAHDAALADAPLPAFKGFTMAWNMASDAEVDQALAHAVACGAKLLKPAQKVFWGGYSGYFADPEGNAWEVAHNPFASFDDRMQLVI
jgi:uncharacterized protein